MIVLTGTMK